MVTPGEASLKAVMFDKPKMLIGLNQKVSGQVQGLAFPRPQMSRHRRRGTT